MNVVALILNVASRATNLGLAVLVGVLLLSVRCTIDPCPVPRTDPRVDPHVFNPSYYVVHYADLKG